MKNEGNNKTEFTWSCFSFLTVIKQDQIIMTNKTLLVKLMRLLTLIR